MSSGKSSLKKGHLSCDLNDKNKWERERERINTRGQKYEPRAFQANGPEYFWHRGPKMEISWN